MPQVLRARPDPQPMSIDARVMAERSIKAGYMKDALKYLEVAHEADPGDFDVMLKLGWTLNLLGQDRLAVRWFDLARRSADPRIASEAGRAFLSLRSSNERIRFTGWFYPMYSTRWNAAFSYAQVRAELRIGGPVHPYLSARLVGDSSLIAAQPLSEQSVILAAGVTTATWRGARGWFEAGNALEYLHRHFVPDYRGGVSLVRRYRGLADATVDAIYVSRFDHDFLVYDQSRIGRLARPLQLYWNFNLTLDAKRQDWANFVETGPGLRVAVAPSSFFTVNLLRGAWLGKESNPRRPNFTDLRAGFWYAFSH
jgi:hypothetical protein